LLLLALSLGASVNDALSSVSQTVQGALHPQAVGAPMVCRWVTTARHSPLLGLGVLWAKLTPWQVLMNTPFLLRRVIHTEPASQSVAVISVVFFLLFFLLQAGSWAIAIVYVIRTGC
jgi:hypothetical protein